jgi:hypothetical protein
MEKMDNDLKNDYKRYLNLCKKSGEKPKGTNEIKYSWLEHYDVLLVKYNIHYNR